MLLSYIKTLAIVHMLLGYIFITSGLIVNFFMFCSCIIWPFSRSLYRRVNKYLAYSIWSQMVFLAEWWSGSEVEVVAPPEDLKYYGKEHGLVVMNHKYDIDWLAGWVLAERCGLLGSTKVYVKDSLRYVPVIGWSWHFTEALFLKRNIEKDKKIIKEQLAELTDYPPDLKVWILLFAEGTRFTEKKRLVSNEVARKKGLPELKHHLLPRTKGFTLSMYALKGIMPVCYNCILGFKDEGAAPTLSNILNGKKTVSQLVVRRLPLTDVPDDEEGASNWLIHRYKEMDDIYDEFTKKGEFSGHVSKLPRRKYDLFVWCFWAILLCTPLFYYVGKAFIFGSMYLQIGVIVALFTVSLIVRMMVGVTQIERGSAYGKKNREKKED
ncbi:1-acyl-sn-glycerol-3-phosphate acyltransferase gamma-like [Lineus longissimus]|uniref:1-acyl-sn-glycerol-3-phosphate acyltransferase gamma-like n=1 Tax=Lineus longissimus TaxID=88925 RepID=UPI002B4F4BC8